jgi:hypothetical protein
MESQKKTNTLRGTSNQLDNRYSTDGSYTLCAIKRNPSASSTVNLRRNRRNRTPVKKQTRADMNLHNDKPKKTSQTKKTKEMEKNDVEILFQPLLVSQETRDVR